MIRAYRSSSSSSVSIVISFPSSSINNLLCNRFCGDTHTEPLLVYPDCVSPCTMIPRSLPQSRHLLEHPPQLGPTWPHWQSPLLSTSILSCCHCSYVAIYHSRIQGLNQRSAHNTHGSSQSLNSQMNKCCLLGSPLFFIALFEFEFDRSPHFRFINSFLVENFPKSCP